MLFIYEREFNNGSPPEAERRVIGFRRVDRLRAADRREHLVDQFDQLAVPVRKRKKVNQ